MNYNSWEDVDQLIEFLSSLSRHKKAFGVLLDLDGNTAYDSDGRVFSTLIELEVKNGAIANKAFEFQSTRRGVAVSGIRLFDIELKNSFVVNLGRKILPTDTSIGCAECQMTINLL